VLTSREHEGSSSAWRRPEPGSKGGAEAARAAFEEFVQQAAGKGELVNLVFEQRLFDLIGLLHKIADPLMSEDVPHEVVGGLAVLIHVEEADPAHSMLTRDIDLMIRRPDLPRVVEIAGRHGFRFRHAAGVDMLLYGHAERPKNAVHLLYSGERVREAQTTPNPEIAPVRRQIHGRDVCVIPLVDLVRMKLSAFRDKDRVHIRSMDSAGLITPEVEAALPEELRTRLRQIRSTE